QLIPGLPTGYTHIVPVKIYDAPNGSPLGRLLFYRASDGHAELGRIDSTGALVDQVVIGGMPTGWTHVAAAGNGLVLFYRASDGLYETGEVTESVEGGTFKGGGIDVGLSPGWTLIADPSIAAYLEF